jgi:signal transduction histidine kinase
MTASRDIEPKTLRDANEALLLALVRADEALESARGETEVAHAREAELRVIAQFRETLLGIVGHDLRNPLNAIFMATKLLTSRPLTESDAKLVGHILSSSQRMKRIIAQLLEFTRARLGGGFPLQLANADLGAICDEIVAEVQLANPARIEVHRTGDLRGRWDTDRLSTMVSNIIGNALEHSTPRTPIVVDIRADGGDVTLAVTNQGATIPPEFLPHIFDPFRQAEPNAPRPAGNLGLGLYIAHQVVTSHEGRLGVSSQNGVTTFTVRLPREQPSQPAGA